MSSTCEYKGYRSFVLDDGQLDVQIRREELTYGAKVEQNCERRNSAHSDQPQTPKKDDKPAASFPKCNDSKGHDSGPRELS